MWCKVCGKSELTVQVTDWHCETCAANLKYNSGLKQMSGIANVLYYAQGSLVGTRRTYCCSASDSGTTFSAYWPNTAYFCPHCGDIWGRSIYEFQFDYAPRVRVPWVIESRNCLAHGDGTFLISVPLSDCDSPLLTRELLALLQGAICE